MITQRIYFVSRNKLKVEEIAPLWESSGLRIEHVSHHLIELQTQKFEDIVRDKARKAFAAVRQPVLVDHSGLALDALNGFPGGLTQSFWDAAGYRTCDLVRALGD